MECRHALSIAAIVVLLLASPLQAQRLGPQVGWGSDTDAAIGGRGEVPFPLSEAGLMSEVFMIGTFDSFDWECPIHCYYWDVGVNLALPIPIEIVGLYAGAGVFMARSSNDDPAYPPFVPARTIKRWVFGPNVFGGFRRSLGVLWPPLERLSIFGEAKAQLGKREQLVLTGGLLVTIR